MRQRRIENLAALHIDHQIIDLAQVLARLVHHRQTDDFRATEYMSHVYVRLIVLVISRRGLQKAHGCDKGKGHEGHRKWFTHCYFSLRLQNNFVTRRASEARRHSAQSSWSATAHASALERWTRMAYLD